MSHRYHFLTMILLACLMLCGDVQASRKKIEVQSSSVDSWSEDLGKLYPDLNAMLRYLYPLTLKSNKKAQLGFAKLLLISPKNVSTIDGCDANCLVRKSSIWICKLKSDPNSAFSKEANALAKEFKRGGIVQVCN